MIEVAIFARYPEKPEYEQAVIPRDITLLNSEQLAEAFTILTGWADYIASEHAFSVIGERDAERALDFEKNKQIVERLGAATKADKVTLIRAQIAIDPRVQDREQLFEEAYAKRKVLEMMLTNQERDITLVSREITRRTYDQRALRKDYGVL